MDLIKKARENKRKMNMLLIVVMSVLELAIVCGIAAFWIAGMGTSLFDRVAVTILLAWVGILLPYYSWLVYFYNINLGLTNEDWAEIREIKKLDPTADTGAPSVNPHAKETMGLPPGTIRGTLALTVTMGGLSMLIASFAMDDQLKEGSVFIDNLEFFKTAFLMVIAFYFGNKSLEAISRMNPVKQVGNQGGSYSASGGEMVEQAPAGQAQAGPPVAASETAGSAAVANTAASAIKSAMRGDDAPEGPAGDNRDDSDTTDFDNPNAIG